MKIKISRNIIINGEQHYYEINFKDTTGQKKSIYPARSYISTKDFANDLIDEGLAHDINSGKDGILEHLKKCIAKVEKSDDKRTLSLFSTPTYHNKTLITCYGCFGAEDNNYKYGYLRDYQKQRLFDPDKIITLPSISKNAEEQRAKFRPYLNSSSSLTIVYLAAFYASLVLMNENNEDIDLNGFTLVASGKGGRGKTTLCLAGHSITDKANDERILLSLSSGDGHNHDELPSRCGSLVGIGDTKSAKSKGKYLLGAIQSYLFSGVEMLARKRKTDTIKLKYNSPLIFLLPIEDSFTAIHHMNNMEVAEGDRRRVIELPIGPRRKGGIFDLKNSSNSKVLANKLKKLTGSQDGCLMNDWVKAFSKLSKEQLRSIHTACYNQKKRKTYWTKRTRSDKLYDLVADNLDHLWFTAKLLNKVGQLPVTLKHVAKCLQIVDEQNRKIITGHGDPLQRKVRRKILKLIKDEKLFPRVQFGEHVKAKSKKAIGFIREEDYEKHLYIRPDGLYAEFENDESKIVKGCIISLINRGYGKKPKNDFTRPTKQEGFGKKGNKNAKPRCWELYINDDCKPEKR